MAVPVSGMIASYRLVADLGEVPGGRLHRATDARSDLPVMLKLLRRATGAAAAAWERELAETRRLTRLDREGIPAVYEVGLAGAALYVAFAPADGRTLRQFVAGGGRVDRATLVDWACQLLDLLAETHALGVLHRHLAADAVTVGPAGRLSLSGFGLTQVAPDASELRPPEAVAGEELTPASDLYALAALIKRLAAPAALGGAGTEALLPDDPLSVVFERATAADPRQRFQDTADLAFAIRRSAAPQTYDTQLFRADRLDLAPREERAGEPAAASDGAGATAPAPGEAAPAAEAERARAPGAAAAAPAPRRPRWGLWLLLVAALLVGGVAAWWLLVANGAWPPWGGFG